MYMVHTDQTMSYIKEINKVCDDDDDDDVMPISQDPMPTPPLCSTENSDQVWRVSILCGWTIHMELSAQVSEKDWLYSDF